MMNDSCFHSDVPCYVTKLLAFTCPSFLASLSISRNAACQHPIDNCYMIYLVRFSFWAFDLDSPKSRTERAKNADKPEREPCADYSSRGVDSSTNSYHRCEPKILHPYMGYAKNRLGRLDHVTLSCKGFFIQICLPKVTYALN